MTFNKHIIVREELGSVYVYNCNNAAIFRMDINLFNRVTNLSNDEITALSNLLTSGFISIAKGKEVGNKPQTGAFFKLRSDKNPFNILWAVTPKCNLSCLYCFPGLNNKQIDFKELNINQLLNIAKQIIDTKAFKVILSGGEAFLRTDLWEVVSVLRDAGLTVVIMSNGTVISDTIIDNLKRWDISVGVSIDGPNEDINSITRGKGNFELIINNIKQYKNNNIPVAAVTTLTRYNFDHLYNLVKLADELKLKVMTIQDLRPFGTKSDYDRARLTLEQEKGLPGLLNKIKIDFPHMFINTTELLVFHKTELNGNIMPCPAGDNLAYIDFNGDVYPCTSLPSFKLGSLLESNITELWQHSYNIKRLRTLKAMKTRDLRACCNCKEANSCDGGCRGDAEFYSGDVLGLPSRCPKLMQI